MTELIGTNAGLVWEVLRKSKKAMTDKDIKNATKISTLRDVYFRSAGWRGRISSPLRRAHRSLYGLSNPLYDLGIVPGGRDRHTQGTPYRRM